MVNKSIIIIYIYIYIYTCIYIYIYTCIYMYICTCIYTYVYTYIRIRVHVCSDSFTSMYKLCGCPKRDQDTPPESTPVIGIALVCSHGFWAETRKNNVFKE